ncbi:hypothetical protein JCM8202v2_000010 [Rhodotorula sphaerocarpa]
MTTPSPPPRSSAGSCPASSLPPSSSARRHRARVLGLAVLTALFHLYSSGWLSAAAHGLDQAGGGGQPGDDGFRGGAGDDARDWEGAERRRVEGVKALLGIARDKLALIRLLMLNGFLSLSLDLVLLSTVFLILTVGNPAAAESETSGLATTVCQALSSSSISAATGSSLFPLSFGLPDVLGSSLEACEEQFEGVLVTALGVLAVVEGARAWVAIRILGYYALLVRSSLSPSARLLRGEYDSPFYDDDAPLELEAAAGAALTRSPVGATFPAAHALPSVGGSGSRKKRRESHGEHSTTTSDGRRRHRDRERSNSGRLDRKRSGDEHKIFLLPRSEDRTAPLTLSPSEAVTTNGKHQEVPLLALTTSSPVSASFPPTSRQDGKKVLVYAPVMVSAEEARSLGATELVLGSSTRRRDDAHPPRSPSHPHAASSPRPPASSSESATPPSARSRSSTITPASPNSTPRLNTAGPSFATAASAAAARSNPSPVKTGSPLRLSTSGPRPPSTLRIDPSLSHHARSQPASPATAPHPQAPPALTRYDSEEAKTPVASLSGHNLALAEDKGNKLA